MKRRSLLIFIAAILLASACVLSACNNNDIPFGQPVAWQNYLEEVADMFAEEVASYDSVLNLDLSGEMILNQKYFNIAICGNFDRNNSDNSNIAIIINDADRNVAFSLFSDNVDTYLEIAPNDYINNAKLKLQQTCLFSYLKALNTDNVTDFKENIKNEFMDLGEIIFRGVDVNADKSIYSFKLNGNAVAERVLNYFKTVKMLDEEIGNIILNIFGIGDASEILSLFEFDDGEVNFYIENGKISEIGTDDITFSAEDKNAIDFDIRFCGEYDNRVKDLFPKSDAGYKVTKVGSTSIDGSLSFIASEGNKYAISYDMSLTTNIDLIRLGLYDFDLSKLANDNFFHFRLSHKCTNDCSRYCVGKLSRSDGAVLDIAFSPEQFGNSNLYICYNLQAFIERDYFREVARYDKNISESSIPEYAMFVLPASNLKGDSEFMKLMYHTYIKLTGIEEGANSYASLEGLRKEFKDLRIADVLFENMFDTEEYEIDTLKYRINQNIYGQAREYDIYKEVVYIKDNDVSEPKKFSAQLSKDYTAYSWSYEEQMTAKDGDKSYLLNNIYDSAGQNLLHGADASGSYVPMSGNEARDITGKTLKLTYKGYNGGLRQQYCEIVGVEGLDYDCYEVQQVILRVKYPNAFDYSFEFGDISYKILQALFRGGDESFVQDVVANIKLTKERAENAFEFISADTNKKYRLRSTSSTVPEMLQATAIIHYENGMEKRVATIGKSDSVLESMWIISKQYSILDWGHVNVNFSVAGRNIARYFEVEKPSDFEFTSKDGDGEIGESCSLTNLANLTAFYGDEKITVKLTIADFYVNNISLADDAADWKVYDNYISRTVVFQKSNDYIVEVKKCGMLFGSFVLHISGRTSVKPTYKYVMTSQPQSVVPIGSRNSFSGTIVNATHGDGISESHIFDVKVMEYYSTSSGINYREADVEDYTLSFEIGGNIAVNNEIQLELPVMILTPISVKFNVTINKAGIYRIALRMDGSKFLTSGIIYECIINVV